MIGSIIVQKKSTIHSTVEYKDVEGIKHVSKWTYAHEFNDNVERGTQAKQEIIFDEFKVNENIEDEIFEGPARKK